MTTAPPSLSIPETRAAIRAAVAKLSRIDYYPSDLDCAIYRAGYAAAIAPPREPTQAMVDAAEFIDRSLLPGAFKRAVWRAMYDAAPAPAADPSTEPGGFPAIEMETHHEPTQSNGASCAAKHYDQPDYPASGMDHEKIAASRQTSGQIRNGIETAPAEEPAPTNCKHGGSNIYCSRCDAELVAENEQRKPAALDALAARLRTYPEDSSRYAETLWTRCNEAAAAIETREREIAQANRNIAGWIQHGKEQERRAEKAEARAEGLTKIVVELVACKEWWRRAWAVTPEGAERDYQDRSAHERREDRAIAAARAALERKP